MKFHDKFMCSTASYISYICVYTLTYKNYCQYIISEWHGVRASAHECVSIEIASQVSCHREGIFVRTHYFRSTFAFTNSYCRCHLRADMHSCVASPCAFRCDDESPEPRFAEYFSFLFIRA